MVSSLAIAERCRFEVNLSAISRPLEIFATVRGDELEQANLRIPNFERSVNARSESLRLNHITPLSNPCHTRRFQ
jgi:hypothetical protein